MQRLQAKIAARLAKLGALTTSPVDGEALAAVRKLNALMHAEQLDWPSIFGSRQRAADLDPDEQFRTLHWRFAVARCLRSGAPYTDKERDFLADLLGFKKPSEKQLAWLRDLFHRACAFAANDFEAAA